MKKEKARNIVLVAGFAALIAIGAAMATNPFVALLGSAIGIAALVAVGTFEDNRNAFRIAIAVTVVLIVWAILIVFVYEYPRSEKDIWMGFWAPFVSILMFQYVENHFDELVKIIGTVSLVLIVGGFGYFAWPVSVWFLCCLIVIGVLYVIRKRWEPNRNMQSSVVKEVSWELEKSGYLICGSLLILCLVQLVLSIVHFSDAEKMLRWELSLIAGREWLSSHLHFDLVTLAFALGIALSVPHLRLVSATLALRRGAEPIVVILIALTSFTFFSSAAITQGEPRWVASFKQEYYKHLLNVERAQKEIVARVYVMDRIETLSTPYRTDLRNFIKHVGAQPNPYEVTEVAAEQVASRAPSMTDAVYKEAGTTSKMEQDARIEQIRRWIHSSYDPRLAPALNDLIGLRKDDRDFRIMAEESKAAISEFAKSRFGDLGESLHPLVGVFLEAVAGALIEHNTFLQADLKGIRDMLSARRWLAQDHSSNNSIVNSWWDLRSSVPASERSEDAMQRVVKSIQGTISSRQSTSSGIHPERISRGEHFPGERRGGRGGVHR